MSELAEKMGCMRGDDDVAICRFRRGSKQM